jgi:hypothetical protein
LINITEHVLSISLLPFLCQAFFTSRIQYGFIL